MITIPHTIMKKRISFILDLKLYTQYLAKETLQDTLLV